MNNYTEKVIRFMVDDVMSLHDAGEMFRAASDADRVCDFRKFSLMIEAYVSSMALLQHPECPLFFGDMKHVDWAAVSLAVVGELRDPAPVQ